MLLWVAIDTVGHEQLMLQYLNPAKLGPLMPGFLAAASIALAAQFIAAHYGAPAMLMALLFGIALHFLSEETACKAGIGFASTTVLRIGVALLGIRISFEMVAELGWNVVGLVVGGVFATIVFGLLVARLFGQGIKFAFLSAGSVAICGASAAMAISAVLPRDEQTEERLAFTVVGVTIMSTIAMITYPLLAQWLGFSEQFAGVFIGASIHDVAQVVGAGFSISEGTGDIATVVKLIRVSMLAPIILILTLVVRQMSKSGHGKSSSATLVPLFVIAFILFAVMNSFGMFPDWVVAWSTKVSRWALLVAIAAVGMKTSLREVMNVGRAAIALLVAETLFIGALVAYALIGMSA